MLSDDASRNHSSGWPRGAPCVISTSRSGNSFKSATRIRFNLRPNGGNISRSPELLPHWHERCNRVPTRSDRLRRPRRLSRPSRCSHATSPYRSVLRCQTFGRRTAGSGRQKASWKRRGSKHLSPRYGDLDLPTVGKAFFHGSKARLDSRSQPGLSLWRPESAFLGPAAFHAHCVYSAQLIGFCYPRWRQTHVGVEQFVNCPNR